MPVFVFCWLPIADYHGNVVVIIDPGDKPQYQCELCPTTCGRKTDLRLHVQKLHTSEKPMSCKLCEKSFPDRYRHLQNYRFIPSPLPVRISFFHLAFLCDCTVPAGSRFFFFLKSCKQFFFAGD